MDEGFEVAFYFLFGRLVTGAAGTVEEWA